MMRDVGECKFTYYPDEVLLNRTHTIFDIDDDVCKLSEKMISIMLKKKGLGLAAPQVGFPLQLFIAMYKREPKVYINPTITLIGSEITSIEEGCLSIPGIFPKIQRSKKCKIVATNLDGNEFVDEAEGIEARVFQHEYDHIDGITIIDRMDQFDKFALSNQLKKLVKV